MSREAAGPDVRGGRAWLVGLVRSADQSADGRTFGCISSMATSQHSMAPSPGLMQRTSELHVPHWNRLPSWLATLPPPECYYFFCSIGWLQHLRAPSPPLVTIISVPHLPHWYRFPTSFATRSLLGKLEDAPRGPVPYSSLANDAERRQVRPTEPSPRTPRASPPHSGPARCRSAHSFRPAGPD